MIFVVIIDHVCYIASFIQTKIKLFYLTVHKHRNMYV